MTTLAAVLLAAGAAWLLLPSRAVLPGATRARRSLPPAVTWGVGAVVSVVVVAVVAAGLGGALWVLAAAVLLGTGSHLVAGALAERRRTAAAVETAQAMQVVAGQLRIGSVPGVALASAARDCRCLERPAATLAIGGDVPRALAEAGSTPGREGLQSLGRAWELGEVTGAPMAGLAVRVADQVRADQETRRVVQAELSGPRATARLLAGLPLVGLLMGRMAGGDPVGFLFGTLAGQACLLAGTCLACAGLAWTERMARRAQEV